MSQGLADLLVELFIRANAKRRLRHINTSFLYSIIVYFRYVNKKEPVVFHLDAAGYVGTDTEGSA